MITHLFYDIRVNAYPETTVSVFPDVVKASSGDNFTVKIMVSDVRDLSSWQVALEYNGSVLNCTAVWLPDNHVFADKNFFSADTQFGPTTTQNLFLVAGAVSLEGSVEIPESGVLCQINFTVEEFGTSYLRIGTNEEPIEGSVGGSFEKWDAFLLDSNVMKIPFRHVNGVVSTGEAKIPPRAMFTFVAAKPRPENVRLTFLNVGLPVFFEGEPILFNSSLSTDQDGTITKYEWDFGDGNTTAMETPIVYHTYKNVSLGITVSLTIWDNDNLSSTPYTQRIEVGLILNPIDFGPYMIFLLALIVLIVTVSVVRRILRRRQH